MKTKKYLIAIAIFGGMLFTAQATDLIDLNGQTTTQVEKAAIKITFLQLEEYIQKQLFTGRYIGVFISLSRRTYFISTN